MNIRRSNFQSRRIDCFAYCAIFLPCCFVSPSVAATTEKAPVQPEMQQQDSVAKLVEQLGDDDYYSRQAAEEKLLELGSDVFDRLHAVLEHSDLEIAARASYILQKLRIEWIHPNDPNAVKLLLDRYDDLSQLEKKERLDKLAALDNAQGVGVLCRVARFEPSLQIARYGALKLLDLSDDAELATYQRDTIESELGGSKRLPVEWVRAVLSPDYRSAEVSQAQWFATIDQELALLGEDSPDTSRDLTEDLIDHYLGMSRESKNAQLVFDLLKRRTDATSGEEVASSTSLYFAFNWIWQKKHYEVSPLLERQYAEEIRGDRLLNYFVALARWKVGNHQEAEELAKQAYDLQADDLRQRESIANLIGELGRHDWAEREWQHAVDELPVLQSAGARRSLASLRLHDRGENKQAAELMAKVCTTIEENKRLKSQVLRNSDLGLFFSQRDYFRACQARDEGDYPLERELLDSAFRYENLDADVLIAMYRSPEADEAYREKTLKRIQQASEELEGLIKERPDDSQSFNHWAWLISNTEGDYDQAVKYSQRSLELSPESPSYLDTLGRCYYAAGELEKAIEVQRKAVAMHPYLQVMQSQLEKFETEFAKKETNP